MNTYVKLLALAALIVEVTFQAGCDQNEAIPETSGSWEVVGKTGATEDLGRRLAADPDFRTLQQILRDADARARLKYTAGASIKRDLAFAKLVERKAVLSESDKSQLAYIRGFSAGEFEQVRDLRNAILERFPEVAGLTEEELQDILLGAGVGKSNAVGKTLDKCSDCYYAYNTCISSAELRHAVETLSCVLLVETLFGGTACYLASLTKYLWSVSVCSTTKQYCLSGNDCLAVSLKDTL